MVPAGFVALSATAAVPRLTVEWKSCPPIPPRGGMEVQFGLAGPLAGADGNYVLVAGGANFENGMPWRGGAKSYHDEIFLLKGLAEGKYSWEVQKMKLPHPLAYSACVNTGSGFVSLGGENENGPVNLVFNFSFSNGKIKMNPLPGLPEAVTAAGATLLDNMIYVAGGLDKNGATDGFYVLSLTQSASGWKKLPPLPAKLSHVVVVAQNAGDDPAVYVFGGRNKTTEVSEFFSTVYKYSVRRNSWAKVSDIETGGKKTGLSAGTGFAFGKNHIILFGGDRGIFFNQTERINLQLEAESNPAKKETLLKGKDDFLTSHPGFSNLVLDYNTVTGEWSEIGAVPFETPVTTVVFRWNQNFVVPSGEIRPGVRTDRVIMFEMKE